jgi:hypothetical protein
MNWIKDNKFLVALLGGTILGAALLFILGSKAASRHQKAKEEFDVAASEASNFERLSLYPRQENRDGKSKALDEYRESVAALQSSFAPFRPEKIENVSPQDFTNRLKAVNDEVAKAFQESGCKSPEGFFCGFENYKTSLATGNATGILGYQLGGIRNLMLALAQSGATSLNNIHRPLLPEESGNSWQPQPDEVARPFPLEISFTGPEKSVRAFLSSIVKPEQQYVVIRSLRVANAKKDPPRASDAKFEKSSNSKAAATNDIFSGAFVLPGDEQPTEGAGETPAPKPAAPAADSSRILAQVLGNEELHVFLRLDLLQFLPAKKLP